MTLCVLSADADDDCMMYYLGDLKLYLKQYTIHVLVLHHRFRPHLHPANTVPRHLKLLSAVAIESDTEHLLLLQYRPK